MKEFVDRVLAQAQPTETDPLVAAGDEASLRKALELEPANEQAIVAMASFLVERGAPSDQEEALSLLERIPETAETRRIAALARTGDVPSSRRAAQHASTLSSPGSRATTRRGKSSSTSSRLWIRPTSDERSTAGP